MPIAFSPAARERLKAAVRDRVLPRFGPDPKSAQSAAARTLKVSQPSISRLLAEPSSGGSLQFVEKVARFLNEDPSVILLGRTDAAVRQLRELPEFASAMSEALKRIQLEHPGLNPQDLEAAADLRAVPEPARVTPGLLVHVALAQKVSLPEDRSSARHTRPRRRT